MKINKLHIGNFGKFKDYTIDFSDDFRIVFGRNEDGKSTIMAFIELMFYNKQHSQGNVLENKPREKYLSWDGSNMSGAIEFNVDGIDYRLQNDFGSTAGRDKIDLINLNTSSPVPFDSKKEIGEIFFGLNLEGFKRSSFIGQVGRIMGAKSDDVAEKLIKNLAETGDEEISSGVIIKRLENAKYGLVSKNGHVGSLVKLGEKLQSLNEEKSDVNDSIYKQLDTQKEYEEYEALENEQRNIKEQLDAQNLSENKEKLQSLLALSKDKEKLQNDIETESIKLDGIPQFIDHTDELYNFYHDSKGRLDHSFGELDRDITIITEEELEKFKSYSSLKINSKNAITKYEDYIHPLSAQLLEEKSKLSENKKRLDRFLSEESSLKPQFENFKKSIENEGFLKANIDNKKEAITNKEELWERERELFNERINLLKSHHADKRKENAANIPLLILGVLLIASGLVGFFLDMHILLYSLVPIGVLALILSFTLAGKRKHDDKLLPEQDNIMQEKERWQKTVKADRDQILESISSLKIQLEDINKAKKEGEQVADKYSKIKDEIEKENKEKSINDSRINDLEMRFEKESSSFEQDILSSNIAELSDGDFDVEMLYEKAKSIYKNSSNEISVLLKEKNAADEDEFLQLHSDFKVYADNKEKFDVLKAKTINMENEFAEKVSSYKKAETFKNAQEIFDGLKSNFKSFQKIKSDLEIMAKAMGIEALSKKEIEGKLENISNVSEIKTILSKEEQESLENRQKELEEMNLVDMLKELASKLSLPKRNIEQIELEIKDLEEKKASMETYYKSVSLALELMEKSSEQMRMSFGPSLNKQTSEIFSKLTGGKYQEVMVTKEYDIQFKSSTHFREAEYLSSGTFDQVYLSLRIAISNLISGDDEHVPIFLDDVLIQYDDKRAKTALSFLKNYAKETNAQIILFTCHNRMTDFGKELSIKSDAII